MTREELARPWHTHGGDGYVYMRGGLARVWAGCPEQANAIVEEHNAAVAAERVRLEERVKELEAELARVAPFLATHNACGYSLRPAPGVTP